VPQDELIQLTSAQDYVAAIGQGASVDRSRELLGKSDAGIALLRRIFWRELDAIRAGRPTKAWRRLEQSSELPRQVAEPAGA
jgi:5,5'-dehydrodivanillate O-demethylase oxygenase subunit